MVKVRRGPGGEGGEEVQDGKGERRSRVLKVGKSVEKCNILSMW